MREGTFTQTVNRLVRQAGGYAWKVSDRFTAGVPDAWYSGPASDLWVEYKWEPKLPKKVIRPKLTRQQKSWLNARHTEGRSVAVVVASPEGSVVLEDTAWNEGVARPDVLLSRNDLVEVILEKIGVAKCLA